MRVYLAQSDRQSMLMLPAVTAMPSVLAEQRTTSACRDRERATLQTIERAFDQAMGGVPGNIRVRPMAIFGVPGPVLVGIACQDDDLLVVGTSSRRLRPFRRCVANYCTSHAGCEVLLVPPNDFAREVDGMHRRRRWREFDALLGKSAPR